MLANLFLSLFSVETVSAQGLAQLAQCSGPDCGTCNVMYMANGIIVWLIGFLFLVFAVLVMRAGIKLVVSGGNQSALTSAKESFTNAIIGFIIILAAWLIVDTLMRALVGTPENPGVLQVEGSRTGFLFWSQVQCTFQYGAEAADPTLITLSDTNHDEEYTDRAGSTSLPFPPPSQTVSNCGVDESALVPIPGGGGRLATADVANHFVSMQRSLAAQGITLTVTSAYRSDARQTELWDQCPVCQREGTVARPCSRGGNGSRHTSGVALDLTSNGSRSDIVAACRAAGASFTMTYQRSGHVHCDWR